MLPSGTTLLYTLLPPAFVETVNAITHWWVDFIYLSPSLMRAVHSEKRPARCSGS